MLPTNPSVRVSRDVGVVRVSRDVGVTLTVLGYSLDPLTCYPPTPLSEYPGMLVLH